jgi:hypothetical protein
MVQISSSTGAEITFKDNYFEVHGTETEVRAAVAFLMDLDLLKVRFSNQTDCHVG